jgi:ABC-type sugar transport system substrate-binding protein
VLSGLAAGCGGDDETAPAETTAAATTAAASVDCVAEATAGAEAATAAKEFTAPGDAYDISVNKGKSVWIIAAALSIPFNANQAKGSEEAARAAGMEPTVIDGKGNVTSWNAGLDQAVGQGADGILLQGVDPKLVSGGLEKAKAKGIPVIDTFNGAPADELVPGTLAHVTASYHNSGRDLARWILADSGCKANTLMFGAPAFAVELDIAEGFEAEYKRLCPDCKLRTHDINDFAQLETELFSETQSALRRDPEVNYIFGTFDGMVTFILPALEQLKSEVKVVSHDGVAENLQLVRDGKQAADGALPPLEVIGWAGIDQIGRAMADLPFEGWTVPDRVVDTASIPASDDAFSVFPDWQGYQSEFKQLWGLEG